MAYCSSPTAARHHFVLRTFVVSTCTPCCCSVYVHEKLSPGVNSPAPCMVWHVMSIQPSSAQLSPGKNSPHESAQRKTLPLLTCTAVDAHHESLCTKQPINPGAKTNTTRQTWNGIVVTRAVVTHMCASQFCCQRERKRTQECHWQHSTVKSITLMKTDCANCTAVATSHAQSQVGDTPWVTQSINRGGLCTCTAVVTQLPAAARAAHTAGSQHHK